MSEPLITRGVLLTGAVLSGTVLAAVLYFHATNLKRRSYSKPVGVPGLHNLGNTCYANALLQGLSSLPSMKRWLDEVDTSLNKDKLGFLDELKDVVLKLNDASTAVYDVSGIISVLAARKWNISIGVEHDLHELLSIFTTTWEEELIEAKKLLLSSSLLQFNEGDPLCENTGKTSSSGGGSTSSNYRNELVFKRAF